MISLESGAVPGDRRQPGQRNPGDDQCSQNAAGRRVALGSLLFKVAGCALVLPLVGPLADWIDHWQFSTAELVIAFHVLYNTTRCLACLPLTGQMAASCTRLMPDRHSPEDIVRPRHLDPGALTLPRWSTRCAKPCAWAISSNRC